MCETELWKNTTIFFYIWRFVSYLYDIGLSCETDLYVAKVIWHSGVGIIKIVVSDNKQRLTWHIYSSCQQLYLSTLLLLHLQDKVELKKDTNKNYVLSAV